jgi:UDP-glucose 4-epimerase
MATGPADGSLRGAVCLVLGAGGFIGGHLCRELRYRGARVHGFGRSRSYPEALEGVRWTTAEFADRAALTRALEGTEYVFHLIGGRTPESSNREPVADLESSAVASLHLLEICRSVGVRKIIFVSSGGTVYGLPATVPIREDAPTNPISAYGVSKLTIEKYLYLYRHLHSLDYAVLRLANPFGPWQDPQRRQGVIVALMQAMLFGTPAEIWGDGHVVRDYLYVADAANAIAQVATYSGEFRVFNVASGIGRSILEVVHDMRMFFNLPAAAILYKPARAADVPVNVLDTSLIQRELRWEARTDWTVGLERTAGWLRQRRNPGQTSVLRPS